MTYLLTREQRIPAALNEVFEFFSRAENLGKITPEYLSFEIVDGLGISMKSGSRIRYRIRILGIPIFWHTEIREFIRNKRFVDVQLEGPYCLWIHTHEFIADGNETVMRDTVEYALPFGIVGHLVHILFVRVMLWKIFNYRYVKISKLFP